MAQGAESEIDANGGQEAVVEYIVGESKQQTGFTHSGVADQQDLEEKVVILLEAH